MHEYMSKTERIQGYIKEVLADEKKHSTREFCRGIGLLAEHIICMADSYEEPIEKFKKSPFYSPEFEDKGRIIQDKLLGGKKIMKTKHNSRFKSVVSLLIVCMMIIGMVPTTFAAQDNEYVDPADSWLTANGRTNELDMNATTTYETQHCYECGKDTTVLTYRVPEYTRSGETAANRGVKYSDGANADGDEYYNLDDGTPGVDAKYTGYHWTKSVCNACGTLNPSDWNAHCYNRNVYGLNPCDHNFFVDFDNTEYMQYNSTQHYVYLKEGEYCAFCKGTYAQAVLGREGHDFTQLVDAQLANNRFYVAETCVDCGYETSEYVVAKSVITSYYGEVDGEAHTVEVADLSENDVTTRIRYGTEAGNCNRTSAPNFTTAGYHTVYYEIDYLYGGEINMTYDLDGMTVVPGLSSDRALGEFVRDNEMET